MVTFTALAFDGRPTKPAPMQVYWAPLPCSDPPNDAYYACYPGFYEKLPAGLDLTPMLVSGSQLSLQVPGNIVTAHPAPASGTAYGTAFVFAIACAGHVQLVPQGGDTAPPAPPLGCFDDTGAALGSDASVFAFAQVYSFADGRTNQNPVISGITFGGAAVDPTQGITVPACPSSGKCSSTDIGTTVPSSSWELDPGDLNSAGAPIHEEIWADDFVTAGSVGNGTLLYDATTGALPSPTVSYTAPTTSGDQVLWTVAHDNRGGVSWLQVPLHVQ
jgi:hypothetical protein